MPESARASELRARLIDELKLRGCLSEPRVEAVMRKVPRHAFLRGRRLETAYGDRAIVTRREEGVPVSSCSQPCVVAVMLEQLRVDRGSRVLEIGAGTGYNAALLAELVGPQGRVVTLDIDRDVVASARRNLDRAGCPSVEVVWRDGGMGFPEEAPYQRIVATVGVWDIPPAWPEQLAGGGLLLAPLWFAGIQVCAALRLEDGGLESDSLRPCGFMRLRGEHAGPESYLPVDGAGRYWLAAEDSNAPVPRELGGLLHEAPRREPLRFSWGELEHPWQPFSVIGLLSGDVWPLWSEEEGQSWIVLGGGGVARVRAERQDEVLLYGSDAGRAVLDRALEIWHEWGRPSLQEIRVTVVPTGERLDRPPRPGRIFRKRWHDYRVTLAG